MVKLPSRLATVSARLARGPTASAAMTAISANHASRRRRVQVIMRMLETAFMRVAVDMRSNLHAVPLLNVTEPPERHRQSPREQKHTDDEIAQDAEVQTCDKIEDRPMHAEQSDQHLREFDAAHQQRHGNG